MKYRIAHIGSFDVENYGDLLFSDVLKAQLEKRIEIEEIIYFAPKHCVMPNRDITVYSVTELEEMAEKTRIDAIIVGGGDFIYMDMIRTYMPHVSKDWMVYEMPYMWMIPSLVAYRYSIPLFWNAVGVPKEFTDEQKGIVAYLCEAIDYITVRDEEAYRTLAEALRHKEISVVPDTVLSIRNIVSKQELGEQFEELGLNFEKNRYIFFQCNLSNYEMYCQEYVNALKTIATEKGWKVLLQPIGYALGDEGVLEDLAKCCPDEFIYSPRHFTQYEILALIANAGMYIGTRIHGGITANSYGVKNIILNTNHYNKIYGFADIVGIRDTVIDNPAQILSVYYKLTEPQEERIAEAIKKIDCHFDIIASLVRTQKKLSVYASKKLVDYIYQNTHMIETLKLEKEAVESKAERSERELLKVEKTMELYKKEYEAILNSKAWKITKPMRKALDRIKKKNHKL